jgi:hypothetical protein
MFTDTMFSTVKSKQSNTCAQVYCTDMGWTRIMPMTKKSEAHETLSLLFARDGVPHTLIMDGAREQTMGEFKRKARQAHCHIKQVEPHSPWSNAAEGAIRELKKGVARNMLHTSAPKCLWDNCAQLEALIRSPTAHDIYKLDGQVPETLVTGSTADISEIAKFKWYQWIYFLDTTVSFPGDKYVLRRYLGPAADIGPAMAAKVLKTNGQTLVRTTFCPLTEDELLSEDEKKKRDDFDKKVKEILGEGFSPEDWKGDPDVEMPLLQAYGNDSGDKP